MLKDATATKNPRSELNVSIGKSWTQEKRTNRIADIDQLGYFVTEFSSILCLFVEFLCLEKLIECLNDLTINLDGG